MATLRQNYGTGPTMRDSSRPVLPIHIFMKADLAYLNAVAWCRIKFVSLNKIRHALAIYCAFRGEAKNVRALGSRPSLRSSVVSVEWDASGWRSRLGNVHGALRLRRRLRQKPWVQVLTPARPLCRQRRNGRAASGQEFSFANGPEHKPQ